MDRGNPMNTCVGLSKRMQIFTNDNISELIRSKFISDDFNHEQIKEISELLCKPELCNITLSSKDFDGKTDKAAPFFNTKYLIKDFDDELMNKLKNPACEIKDKKLGLPPPNNLIPKKFDIKPKNEAFSVKPVALKKDETGEYWYKKDDKFERPKAVVNSKVFTTDCEFGKTAEGRTFANLW